MVMTKWEIRPIKPKSIYKLRWCSEGICCCTATHYLVRLPEPGTMDMRESRSRRCEACARENARRMGIPFPEIEAIK